MNHSCKDGVVGTAVRTTGHPGARSLARSGAGMALARPGRDPVRWTDHSRSAHEIGS